MTPPVIDPQVLAELQQQAGAEFVRGLVDTFAEEGPEQLAIMRAAVSAADGPSPALRRAAHSIKSNATTFGAGRLAALARALELGERSADAAALDELQAALDEALAAMRASSTE